MKNNKLPFSKLSHLIPIWVDSLLVEKLNPNRNVNHIISMQELQYKQGCYWSIMFTSKDDNKQTNNTVVQHTQTQIKNIILSQLRSKVPLKLVKILLLKLQRYAYTIFRLSLSTKVEFLSQNSTARKAGKPVLHFGNTSAVVFTTPCVQECLTGVKTALSNILYLL